VSVPGDAEADFKESVVEIAGVRLKAHCFMQVLPHSGVWFCCGYPKENAESFADGHARAFAFFGGVPRRCVYDNAGYSVKRGSGPIKGRGRNLTNSFSELQSAYLFEADGALTSGAGGWRRTQLEQLGRFTRQNERRRRSPDRDMVILPFSNLPLVEVVARITFVDPLPLGLAFVGDLYDLIRNEFEMADDDVIEQAPGSAFEFSGRLLQAASFNHRQHPGVTVKVQRRMLRASWQKTSDQGYPGFETTLVPLLRQVLEAIHKLVGHQDVSVLNMSYQNSIDGIEPPTLSEYIALPVQVHIDGRLHQLEFMWRNAEEVDQRVRILGIKTEDETRVVLTNVAGTRLNQQTDLWAAMERIHDVLCISFRDGLTAKAKKDWGYGN
jgi:uncharacterized protein (TIGR04255 family)